MRPSTIVYLYRVRLRARLVQELLAVAGIAVGVALLFASQVANTSLAGSVNRLTDGLVGKARLQLEARDPQGFPEQLLSRTQRLSGVSAAAPVLQRSVYLVGPTGRVAVSLIGLSPGFSTLQGQLLSHVSAAQLSRQQGLALPAPVARKIGVGPLQTLRLESGATATKTLAAVILQPGDIGELIDSPVAIAPLQLAQNLTGMQGRINRVLVEPGYGRDKEVKTALESVAGGTLNVTPANFEAAVFSQAEGPTAQSTQMFSALSALVGFLFAFNAMLLTVPQRRSLIADLRLDGYSPLEIFEVMFFDVLVLGVIGVLAGLALGDLLSRSLLEAEPGYLALAFPVGALHIISVQSVIIAAAGGILAAIVGVMIPLRTEIFGHLALGPRPVHSSKWAGQATVFVIGLLCLALTTATLIHGLPTVGIAILSFTSLMAALLLIMPTAFTGAVWAIERLQSPARGVAPRIALIELMSSTTRSRSLAIAATGAVAVFGSVAIEGAQTNLSNGLRRAAAGLSGGTSLWVSPPGGATTMATVPFKNNYEKALERLPGVSGVGIYRGGFLDLGDRRVLVVAPPKSDALLLPADQVIEGDPVQARSKLARKGWIVTSQALARERGLRVGGTLVLASPRPTQFRVAAIITNLGWSPGAIIMNEGDYEKAWDSPDLSAYQVTLKPRTTVSQGIAEVDSVIGSIGGLTVQTAARHERNDVAAQRQGLARLTQIAALVLVAAALAMAAAMGAMIWQRRPRLAGMKVDGFDQGELWRALLWETTLLMGTGCSIGAIFGLYGQLALSRALVSVTGFPVIYSVAIPVAIVSLAIVSVIALAMVALPGYLAARVKPALQD